MVYRGCYTRQDDDGKRMYYGPCKIAFHDGNIVLSYVVNGRIHSVEQFKLNI